ncbi:MAG: hypothetical protein II567_12650 [Candidatus Riflebacteria bacterium]|nr:hypothetical protein [Candidatus Riflebacteria bacterium]MBR4329851.1 hypothetical protein [Candidatus Riflebacteria bacterium]MBR4570121.1 hypothetical protein [Candidatus Riflebacteria bacterium]
MLIHIGANEFVGMNKCELMVNLQTIDEDSKKRILAVLPKLSEKEEYKSAILTTEGKWIGSTLSTESLSQRGICSPFSDALFVK